MKQRAYLGEKCANDCLRSQTFELENYEFKRLQGEGLLGKLNTHVKKLFLRDETKRRVS